MPVHMIMSLELWDDQDDFDPDMQNTENSEDENNQDYVFFLLMFQTLFWLSDVALKIIFAFFATFLGLIVSTFKVAPLQALVTKLPRSLISARKVIGTTLDNFVKYVCCPQYHSIYHYDECVLNGKQQDSQKCSYIKFSTHPQSQHRTPCGTVLLKTVKSSTGNKFLYPKLV